MTRGAPGGPGEWALHSDYTEGYYEDLQPSAASSAAGLVPVLLHILPAISSAVDVGCGTGAWLRELREAGVDDVLGIDHPRVPARLRQLEPGLFRGWDLRRPYRPERMFDLAICLEVAEHLPPESAQVLIDTLTALAPVVLFSAAIPGQGGTGHVNEQWPTYWAALFRGSGFTAFDCIRRHVWRDPLVDWWYAQNTFLYVRSDRTEIASPRLGEPAPMSGMNIVHPANYLRYVS